MLIRTTELACQPSTELQLEDTAIDLFAGCGGTSLGLRQAGFNVVAAVEIDAHASDCYRTNHPGVRLLQEDVRNVTSQMIWKGDTPPSLIAACPPCQGFSAIRNRNSVTNSVDKRNNLYLEFLRLVSALKPRHILLENVPPFSRSQRFPFMLRRLAAEGYWIRHTIANAADFGVPQRRNRLVLIGSRAPIPNPPTSMGSQQTVREALKFLSTSIDLELDELHNLRQDFSEMVRRRICSIPPESTRKRATNFEPLPCHQNFDGFHDVYGRMRFDEPSPTITSGVYSPSKGRYIHPIHDRCITLREAAILQGFPSNYSFPISAGKMRLASMIGNAAPPPLIARFARHLHLAKH